MKERILTLTYRIFECEEGKVFIRKSDRGNFGNELWLSEEEYNNGMLNDYEITDEILDEENNDSENIE